MNHQWTYPELEEAAERFAAGETWTAIAASFGSTADAVRTLVRRYGLKVDRPSHQRAARKTDALTPLLFRALAYRNTTQKSWSLIAEELAWPHSPRHLRNLCVRLAQEQGCTVKRGYPKKRRSAENEEKK